MRSLQNSTRVSQSYCQKGLLASSGYANSVGETCWMKDRLAYQTGCYKVNASMLCSRWNGLKLNWTRLKFVVSTITEKNIPVWPQRIFFFRLSSCIDILVCGYETLPVLQSLFIFAFHFRGIVTLHSQVIWKRKQKINSQSIIMWNCTKPLL